MRPSFRRTRPLQRREGFAQRIVGAFRLDLIDLGLVFRGQREGHAVEDIVDQFPHGFAADFLVFAFHKA